jgi:cephalosporin-C deacetylase-like acetyl esterase
MTLDAYWDAVDAELARVPMAPTLEPLPLHSLESATLYLARFTSIGPYRITGYLSVPKAPGPHPGLLLTPRYGSVNHIPDVHDRERYTVLQVIHRGQRLADKPFAASYPGLLTLGIDSPSTYIYRSIVADCLRGYELLRAQVADGAVRDISVQGDDLALITAARRPDVRTVLASDLLLYRLLDNAALSDAYPAEELNDYLRVSPEKRAAVDETLRYFDPRQHVGRITATTLLPSADDAWLAPLRAAFQADCLDYRLTYQGQIDHDWLDAWFAERTGSEPRSRFLQNV